MSDDKPERPILHARMPLKNFRFLREFTKEESAWFNSLGRHLEAARKSFDGERG